jgi:CheY-like chemotaxis protein
MRLFLSKDMMAMFKILIVDSNMLFRTSLEKSLSNRLPAVEIQDVGSATE